MAIEGRGRTVVIGDDCPEDRNYLETVLQTQGYAVRFAGNGEEVLSLLEDDRTVSLVLLDAELLVNAFETLRELRRRHKSLPVVFMSENPESLPVQEMIRERRVTLLEKPFLPADLLRLVPTEHPLRAATGLEHSLSGQSLEVVCLEPYMVKIETLIQQVGMADIPVLLQGETGVGKEVLARRIHSCSPRSRKQFVKVNCAALPTELVESELFGFERGAFSGAFQQRQGLFETAHEGTILLDEIGDMDVRLQAKLLQVLQDGEFRRLGGRELVKVDVRVMAATHQDLCKAIEEGHFREDLYYRLNVVSMKIPPLRERRAEILPLAEVFLRKYATRHGMPPTIPSVLREAMLDYDWPGNVRELENAMRRLLIVRNPLLLAEELKTHVSLKRPLLHKITVSESEAAPENDFGQTSPLQRAEQTKRSAERQAVLSALKATHWNRKRAAELLQIDYKALLYKMKKLAIGPERTEQGKPMTVAGAEAHSISAAR